MRNIKQGTLLMCLPLALNATFLKTFFPAAIMLWNKLDPSLRDSASNNVFKNNLEK